MSWDLAISLFFAIVIAFALVIGRPRTVLVLLAAYAGIAVANIGGGAFYDFFKKLFEGASLFVVQAALFSVITLLLVLRGEFTASGDGPKQMTSTLMTIGYGFLMAGLALATVFSFMGQEQLSALYSVSKLAQKIHDLRFWWVILPVILMISSSFLSKTAPSKE